MDTSALKNFATRARTDLIREVGARLDAVLAPASSVSAEQPRAFAALTRAVNENGRDVIVDRVAYAWFNRIIALRFMDANLYTGVGVVSPEPGKDSGQPQVLSDAKGGDFDTDVVDATMRADITALLNGTRTSSDAQGEAYGLLLEAYCRFWNESMPFMFEREGDYTELLIPTGLLAADSVRDRAVKVMTADVCNEVEVIGWLYQFYISERKDEVFAGFKRNKKAGAAEIPAATQLFTPHWIVRYLVENSIGRLWLLNHPESQLASQMHYYIAPVEEETNFLKIDSPEELKIVDPAVGSGHMLTYAFDLLYAIYEEESYSPSEIPATIIEHNLFGVEIDPRAGALAAFALTMKATKKRKLFLKKAVQPNVTVLQNVRFEQHDLDYLWSLSKGISVQRVDFDRFWNTFEHADTFGSLIEPDEKLIGPLTPIARRLEADGNLLISSVERVLAQSTQLAQRYAIAIANPPYMGTGNAGALLTGFANERYPLSKSDLFSMFIQRCSSLSVDSGYVSMITMQGWMFLSSFSVLRDSILASRPILTLAHLGSGAFDSIGGDVVATCAFVLGPEQDAARAGSFLRLTAGRSESQKENRLAEIAQKTAFDGDLFVVAATDFRQIEGAPIAYWLTSGQLQALLTADKIGAHANLRKGLVTLDDARFTRRWFEVSRERFCSPDEFGAVGTTRKWYPLNKGGGYRRWYGFNEVVINWQDNGRELKDSIIAKYGGGSYTKEIRSEDFYFQENVTWGAVSTGIPTFRYTPPGGLFSSGGSSLFMQANLLSALAVLNSQSVSSLLKELTPTMNFVAGDVGRMPFTPVPDLEESASRAIDIARRDWDSQELSWDFQGTPTAAFSGDLSERVSQVVRADDELTGHMAKVQRHIDITVSSRLGLDDAEGKAPQAISLFANKEFEFGSVSTVDQRNVLKVRRLTLDLISYAVGTMFGRYSLDEPGLILADQGDTLEQYFAKVPAPSFLPDADNVIPIVDGDWFLDDILGRFRQFLRAAFGEEHFEENLRFIVDSLGVKDLRDYFVKSFYKDHVQRYKRRPIYWLFSSPKNSFSALIYLHRYTSSMVSTVLNEYLREFIKKLEGERDRLEFVVASGADAKAVAAAQKESDRLRKVLIELDEYERELHKLASQQIAIDLDDGVLVNYQKFGTALRDIGLKKSGADA